MPWWLQHQMQAGATRRLWEVRLDTLSFLLIKTRRKSMGTYVSSSLEKLQNGEKNTVNTCCWAYGTCSSSSRVQLDSISFWWNGLWRLHTGRGQEIPWKTPNDAGDRLQACIWSHTWCRCDSERQASGDRHAASAKRPEVYKCHLTLGWYPINAEWCTHKVECWSGVHALCSEVWSVYCC